MLCLCMSSYKKIHSLEVNIAYRVTELKFGFDGDPEDLRTSIKTNKI